MISPPSQIDIILTPSVKAMKPFQRLFRKIFFTTVLVEPPKLHWACFKMFWGELG